MVLIIEKSNASMTGGALIDSRNINFLIDHYGIENTILYSIKPSASKINSLINLLFGFVLGFSIVDYVKINKIVNKQKINLVYVSSSVFGFIVPLFSRKRVKTICFFHNVETIFCSKIHNKGFVSKVWQRAIKESEKKAVKFSSILLTLNLRDSNDLLKLYGRGSDFIIPTTMKDLYHDKKQLVDRNTMLFIGSDFYANVNGLRWFIDNCLDNINGTLIVIGKGMEKYKKELQHKNLNIIGVVDNLEPYYSKAHCVVLPIFEGSGMKTKTAEALMYGKMIFGTDEAFEGYDIVDSCSGFKCNNKYEFISKINNYFNQDVNTFNQEARLLFLHNHSEAVFEKVMNSIVSDDSTLYSVRENHV